MYENVLWSENGKKKYVIDIESISSMYLLNSLGRWCKGKTFANHHAIFLLKVILITMYPYVSLLATRVAVSSGGLRPLLIELFLFELPVF